VDSLRPKGENEAETIQLTLKQKDWMKATIIACDRAGLSDDFIFHLCTFLVSNGVDIDDVIISPSIISQLRRELHLETDAAIKVRL
jgi:phosphoribosyl-ATP pyrophosphohydrolase